MDLVLFMFQGPAGNPGLAGQVGFKGDRVCAFFNFFKTSLSFSNWFTFFKRL